MATLARRLFKTVLFLGLFLLSVRYVHTYPVPMTEEQLGILLAICDALDIRDPENLYIPAMLVLELLTTITVYILIIKSWRLFKAMNKKG